MLFITRHTEHMRGRANTIHAHNTSQVVFGILFLFASFFSIFNLKFDGFFLYCAQSIEDRITCSNITNTTLNNNKKKLNKCMADKFQSVVLVTVSSLSILYGWIRFLIELNRKIKRNLRWLKLHSAAAAAGCMFFIRGALAAYLNAELFYSIEFFPFKHSVVVSLLLSSSRWLYLSYEIHLQKDNVDMFFVVCNLITILNIYVCVWCTHFFFCINNDVVKAKKQDISFPHHIFMGRFTYISSEVR